jgi:hypothetical protein
MYAQDKTEREAVAKKEAQLSRERADAARRRSGSGRSSDLKEDDAPDRVPPLPHFFPDQLAKDWKDTHGNE